MKYLQMFTIGGIMGILIFNYLYMSHGITDSHIKELQTKNDSLMMANERIDSLNSYYIKEIEKKDIRIGQLNTIDLKLETQIKEATNKINNLKSKYEKANNHAIDFNSIQISSYFADSLR